MNVCPKPNGIQKALKIAWLLAAWGYMSASSADSAKAIPLESIREFTSVFELIKQSYVEDVDDATLFRYAIEGMLQGLDPHSDYLDQEAYSRMRKQEGERYGGVGLTVRSDRASYPIIADILPGSPAHRAQLRSLDRIVSVNNQDLHGLELEAVVSLVRGEIGTDVTLIIQRGAHENIEEIAVELTREYIERLGVEGRRLADDIAYLKVADFRAGTAVQVRGYLQRWQYHDPIQGLVLDLRDNPGGTLASAVDVCNLFLKEGVIVSVGGKKGDRTVYRADASVYVPKVYMVVLINEGTASAAEIVAGALQQHKRALVVGTNSFGKGSVQTLISLSKGGALKLTTDLYYLKDDISIQAAGIAPDIEIQLREVASVQEIDATYERDMPNHLPNQQANQGLGPAATEPEDPFAKQEQQDQNTWLHQDNQLREAYQLVLGLSLQNARR